MGLFDITFKRRCIAVDVGQSRIKAILAERKGKRLDVLHAFTLDLQDEGLLTPEETNHHISRILREMGDYPVALAIPQHVAVSHLVALPSGVKSSRSRMIETETQNLTGLSEGAIVYDYFRLKSEKGSRNTVWVTVSGEQELAEHIRRLQTSGLAVKEVTNAGNALASTFLATHSSPHQRVALVDIGATSTTVVVLERMQPAFAGTLPYGGEFFTQAIADNLHLPFDEAETIKKTEPVFEGKDCPEFAEAVGRWQQEIEKLLGEYLKEGEGGAPALEVLLAGGGSFQAGLVDFLQESSSLRYRLWRGDPCGVDLQTYGVAYGAALAGHRNAPVRCSLLPKPVRQERFRALQVKLFNAAAAVLMAVIFVLLIGDASAKREKIQEKMGWLAELEHTTAQTRVVEELIANRNREYQAVVPFVQQQNRMRDFLKTICLMQSARADYDIWFVLLADGRSYYERGPTLSALENESPALRRTRGTIEPSESPARNGRPKSVRPWNQMVVELVVPGDAQESHEVLMEVVDVFKTSGIFQNVDTLAHFERVAIVGEDVTIPGQTFSLNLELIPCSLDLDSFARGNMNGPILRDASR